MASTDDVLGRDRLALVAVIDRGAPGWPHLAEVDPEPAADDDLGCYYRVRRLCDQQPVEALLSEWCLLSHPDTLASYGVYEYCDRCHDIYQRSVGQLEVC